MTDQKIICEPNLEPVLSEFDGVRFLLDNLDMKLDEIRAQADMDRGELHASLDRIANYLSDIHEVLTTPKYVKVGPFRFRVQQWEAQ